MRDLILMRHAKSSWDDLMLDDHDRPLNKRGRASARALGDWLRAQEHIPDTALVSSAQRTGETFLGLKLDIAAEYKRGLYHAGPEAMMAQLQAAQGQTVLMIGHNPGIAEFAQMLAAEPPDHPRFHDYPTGATLVLRFEGEDWSATRWASGQVTDFVIPRELLGDA